LFQQNVNFVPKLQGRVKGAHPFLLWDALSAPCITDNITLTKQVKGVRQGNQLYHQYQLHFASVQLTHESRDW